MIILTYLLRQPDLLAAARALINRPEVDAEEIVRESMKIASDLCVYTNHNYIVEVSQCNDFHHTTTIHSFIHLYIQYRLSESLIHETFVTFYMLYIIHLLHTYIHTYIHTYRCLERKKPPPLWSP